MLIFILAELKEEPPGDPGTGPRNRRNAMFLERPKSAEVCVHDERAQWCRVGSMLGHPSAWAMARGHRRPTSSYSPVGLVNFKLTSLRAHETLWSRRAKPDCQWVAAGACGARPYPPPPVEEFDPLCSRWLRIREPNCALCAPAARSQRCRHIAARSCAHQRQHSERDCAYPFAAAV